MKKLQCKLFKQKIICLSKLFIPFSFLVFLSCNNQTTSDKETQKEQETKPEINLKQEANNLCNFLKKYQDTVELYKISGIKTSLVKGKKGTQITVIPADLETEDGQPVGKNIDLELKELITKEDFIRENIQTVSNGQLLISGGAFYINMKSDSKQLKLKEGKTLKIKLPKISDDEMSLFYGQKDSLEKMNWSETKQIFKAEEKKKITFKENIYDIQIVTWNYDTIRSKSKAMTKEEIQKEQNKVNAINDEINKESRVYAPIELFKFGWINCDRFLNTPNASSSVKYTISNTTEKINYAQIYLVLKNYNSLISSVYFKNDISPEKNMLRNLPAGEDMQLFAVAYQDKKIYTFITDIIKLKKNTILDLMLKEVSENEYNELLKKIK